MSHPITVLWTVPRSVSTSFERMMSARGDHTVVDEPFSVPYYYGPERRSPRYDETLPESSAQEVLASIERAAEERPVFVKDMAYHASDRLDPEFLGRFRNCFLVRDPAATLRSFAKRWPDFTDEEAGFGRLDEAARVVESLGQPLVVLDADRLCADPAGVVSHVVRADGHRPRRERAHLGARHAGGVVAVGRLARLDLAVHRLRGAPPPPPPPGPDEPRLQEAYAAALPVYERLSALAI